MWSVSLWDCSIRVLLEMFDLLSLVGMVRGRGWDGWCRE